MRVEIGRWSKSQRLMHKVAYLLAERLTQSEIMDRLDVSQSTVSRYSKLACEAKLVEERAFVWRGPPELLGEIGRLMTSVDELEDRLRQMSPTAKRLIEVEIIEDVTSTRDEISDGFAKRAAGYLLSHELLKTGLVGVAWGGTLLKIAEAVEAERRSKAINSDGPSFVPICGDPLEVDRHPRHAAAHIAGCFESAITGKTDFDHSFSSVAACIPHGFDGDRADTIRKFFRTNPGYANVFGAVAGKKDALVSKLTGCLTSLRSNVIDESWLEAASAAAGVKSATLAAASTGNIGGVFLAKPDATQDDIEVVNKVNERWTGIRLEDLERCARSAAKDNARMGVVVIAGRNASQVATAIECVRLGIASRLILDPHTADSIKAALEP